MATRSAQGEQSAGPAASPDAAPSPARPQSKPRPGRAGEGSALYVHLPFCAAKCHYCDFFSVPAHGQDVDAMVAAILREAGERAPRRPRTVYLGGGTPSLLSARQLRDLLDGLEHLTCFRSSAVEVTAECNPESLDRDKARVLLDLGITRLSIGFQSLRAETLQLFGRVHGVEQSFQAFEAARAAGARRLNVDLIYASPGQTVEEWSEDLRAVLALRPEHLSAYNLTFEDETPFQRWLGEGRLSKHGEEAELAFFAATRELAEAGGLTAYEVSNFSATGHECAHNLNYWRNGPYTGLGPSAVSKVGDTRCGNARSISEYLRGVQETGQACAWSETPAARTRLGETWWLGLRLREGVDPALARQVARLPPAEPDPALPVAQRMQALGLLEEHGGRFALTARGLPLADAVAREFLSPTRLPG